MNVTKLGGTAFAILLLLVALKPSAVAGSIHDATKRSDIQKVRELLSTEIDINKDLDEHGATALHWAAVKGQKEIAEMLLAKGAKLGLRNRYGDTPMYLAVAFRHKDIVELLLSKGTSVDERWREGTTPLFIAVDRNEKG